MRQVVFYRTGSGRCPVTEFLDALDPRSAQKVSWVLQLVEELDEVPVQYFKKLTGSDGIWEVRARSGGNTYRVLGFLDGDRLVVLNHAFHKKTRKTPQSDIRKAEHRKRDYLARKNS
ncbi:type II toxin-antitoxin system RelE/ParE family toxin [Marinihelvus fidelis]|uniref:Type II toxin-antitoxin system RelE/ParE family toxin n=1 Tax=Marinihelvus fidelis TaxID=2613842 RepID=A0A5N0TES8_9GAMM|nr:type II toxin-antitoxin system RelE/ParE family toxin [Marinihelvus fidelis]